MAPQYDAVVVGAGFGGMGAAIQLKQLGLDNLTIVDREEDLGGTWHVNHYPGLAVDIASVTYSYSFEPNPGWSRLFAPGAELKKYADHVADKYDLRRHMRFGAAVVGARWDDDEHHWVVAIDGGDQITARYLVAATGFLSQAHTPDFPGLETFAGEIIHTTEWDDSYDPAGRSIGVIGTGATAVQLIPELARVAAALTVYQRTPIWVVPKPDLGIPRPVRQLFAMVPSSQRVVRWLNSALLEGMSVGAVVNYRRAPILGKIAAGAGKAYLRVAVRDRDIRDQLTPSYDFGCKRPTFSNGFYQAFNKPNVRLETSPIERIVPDGIITADGNRISIDTLILATGFNLWDVNFPALEIIGRDGRDLGKWWRDNRFQAYEGMTVPRFPNFMNLASPYAFAPSLSYFDTIESQMKHIARLFGVLRERNADVFEVTDEANTEFLERMSKRLGDTVFHAGNCAGSRSYYFDPHGEATLLRPTSTRNAYHEAEHFPIAAYTYT